MRLYQRPSQEKIDFLANLSKKTILGIGNKEISLVSFFAMLGRLFKFTKKIKENLAFSNLDNLSEIQLKLLNDNAHLPTGLKVLGHQKQSWLGDRV